MPFVYSTMSCDNFYPRYVEQTDQGGPNVNSGGLLIKGGANIAQRKYQNDDGTHTPPAVRTELSEDELEFLKTQDAFQFHVDGGFLIISESKEKVAKIAADLEAADGSSQFTAADYDKGGRASKETNTPGMKPLEAPKVGAIDEDDEE